MKTKSKDDAHTDKLKAEYDLAELLPGGVQGKYADRCREGTNVVILAPDVASAFPTDEAVNEALRLVIKLKELPKSGKKKAA